MEKQKLREKLDGILEQIEEVMHDPEMNDLDKKLAGIDIAIHAILWSAETGWEACGMFEAAKNKYYELLDLPEKEAEDEKKLKRGQN